MNNHIFQALSDWFNVPGAYVLIDGQFGSTGKGLVAAALAECFWRKVDVAVSNAGPNSGHTSYVGDEKIVLKQLPTFSVVAQKVQHVGTSPVLTYLDAGAVIDPEVLFREMKQHKITPLIHPAAAIIDSMTKSIDQENVRAIASTGQGVGPALERKLRRVDYAVVGGPMYYPMFDEQFNGNGIRALDLTDRVCFLEVPQGFSLGINSGFYPHVTTRECTVSQALADAGLPPNAHRKTIMTVRTYPIKVGSTENTSGPCYEDQKELTWEEIGVKPELTTVTQRIRRVFTWSRQQFMQAIRANHPDVIVLTFCDYLRPDKVSKFIRENIIDPYRDEFGIHPESILLSFGPKSENLMVHHRIT